MRNGFNGTADCYGVAIGANRFLENNRTDGGDRGIGSTDCFIVIKVKIKLRF